MLHSLVRCSWNISELYLAESVSSHLRHAKEEVGSSGDDSFSTSFFGLNFPSCSNKSFKEQAESDALKARQLLTAAAIEGS